MQRLGAVVPDAHGDAAVVEELADVVGVHPVDVEARQADALRAGDRTEHAHAGDGRRGRR